METEGMVLQLAKLQKGSENEKLTLCLQFIHIPFGSGVILPSNQLHAGHYGKKGNLQFHAILVNETWEGSSLLLLDNYLIDYVCDQ